MIVLLQDIELYLKTHRMAPARFGREAVGDPSFVFRLQAGRTARAATEAKVRAFLAAHAEHSRC